MITFVIYSSLFIFINFLGNIQVEASTLCAGYNITSQPVIDYCRSQNGYLIHRCCRSYDNGTFIAVDLIGLNLSRIPDFTESENLNLSVIDLRSNPLLNASDNDFLTLKYLDDLFLPIQVECPGDTLVWEEVNKTTDIEGNRCMHQKDFCSNSTYKCSEQSSYCSTNGPNHFLCLCKDGYKGYKCLRHGKFPTGAFFGSTIGVTVVVSVLLYCTNRRHVIK